MGRGMKKLLLGSAAFLLLSAGVASATDMPIKAPVYKAAAPFSWSGLYVGAHGGYGWGKDRFFDGSIIGGETSNFDPRGGFGGLQIGYNQQLGGTNWVLGTEFDISWGRLKDSALSSTIALPGTIKIDMFGTDRARLGYAFDRTLVYVTGGMAWSNNDVGLTGGALRNFDGYHVGWTAGAGLEYAFDPRWSVKIEYLYADLGKSKHLLLGGIPESTNGLSLNMVRAGINYRFGNPVESRSAMPVKGYAAAPLWTGSYIGVHAGYGWSDVAYSDGLAAQTSQLNPSGGFGGFQSGYNWQFAPSWVFGLEGDSSYASLKDRGVTSPGAVPITAKIDDFSTVRARLGYVVDRTLFYGTGGLAYSHQKIQETAGGVAVSTVKAYQVGWTAGGGIEYSINLDWSAKIEYLYADFGKDRYRYLGALGINPLDLTMNTVKVGLNYHGPVLERFFGGR